MVTESRLERYWSIFWWVTGFKKLVKSRSQSYPLENVYSAIPLDCLRCSPVIGRRLPSVDGKTRKLKRSTEGTLQPNEWIGRRRSWYLAYVYFCRFRSLFNVHYVTAPLTYLLASVTNTRQRRCVREWEFFINKITKWLSRRTFIKT